MAQLTIPYLCSGEVLQINETPAAGDAPIGMGSLSALAGQSVSPKLRPIVSYVCKITLADGNDIICRNVVDSSAFGGIADYSQIRRRATADASVFTMKPNPSDMNANVGDRVIISFLGGHINSPVIVTGLQHPLQVPRFEDGSGPDTNPQLFFRYLGISCVIDEDGQLTLSHYGAPEIKYTGSVGIGGLAGDALGAVGGLGASGYEAYEEGDLPSDEADSDAVVPQDFKFKTTFEFLKTGMFRLRDSIGQNITIDPEASTIEITNNGMSSTQDPTGGALGGVTGLLGGSGEDAEVIRFDKVEQSIFINSRKLTTIYSGDAREDTTVGDYTKSVEGNEDVTITGDQTVSVSGGVTREILGDFEDSIMGASTVSVTGDMAIDTKGTFGLTTVSDITVDTKGGITVSAIGDGAYDFKGALGFTVIGDYGVDTKGNIVVSAVGDISILDKTGAGIKISSGKVEVGNSVAGIFAMFSEALQQISGLVDAITQATYPTPTGPSGPAINSPDFIKLKLQFETIKGKIDSAKGSL